MFNNLLPSKLKVWLLRVVLRAEQHPGDTESLALIHPENAGDGMLAGHLATVCTSGHCSNNMIEFIFLPISPTRSPKNLTGFNYAHFRSTEGDKTLVNTRFVHFCVLFHHLHTDHSERISPL